jgi:hypothetical protein
VSPDHRLLVLVSGGAGGIGGADLWGSCRQGDDWGEPVNLGERVNSRYADFAPSFTADGRWLFFTSERPGVVGPRPEGERPPGDLYYVRVDALPLRCEG